MESKIINSGLKNIIYMLLTQLISLMLSILTAFILPAILGVAQFGYWQIYVFYTAYVGLFCIGYNDGLYLRYGSVNYNDLPFKILKASLKPFLAMLIMFSCTVITIVFFFENSSKIFVFSMVAINIFVQGINGTFSIVYQFTNRIRLYGISIILNKILLLISIITFLSLHFDDYKLLIIVDLFIKVLVLIFNMYFCKELTFGKSASLKAGLIEMKNNMSVGISLMLANILGMLVLGIGNFFVERFRSVEEYGLYAFAISTTNLSILFISSVSLALYPMLKRISINNVPKYYNPINSILCVIVFSVLILYYPVKWIIINYMPAYIPTLDYLFILFPIVAAQGKIQLLVNTYYKVLREEKMLLKVNISSILFFLFKSVFLLALCILLTMVWRCYSSEIYLKKKLRLKNYSNIIVELIVLTLFIILAILFKNIYIGFFSYLFVLIVYVLLYLDYLKENIIKIYKYF